MGKKVIVIKLGSSILMTKRRKLDEFRISHIADQVVALREKDYGVLLVVSGAVACGSKVVDFSKNQNHSKELMAGIGQAILISTLRAIFLQKKIQIAQLLLTKNDFVSPYKEKVQKIIDTYIDFGIVAIINENDVIDLHSFGGNDYLASEIAQLMRANKLLILSTFDPSFFGVGGGESKQKVVAAMKDAKIKTDILNGKERNSILNHLI